MKRMKRTPYIIAGENTLKNARGDLSRHQGDEVSEEEGVPEEVPASNPAKPVRRFNSPIIKEERVNQPKRSGCCPTILLTVVGRN